VFFSLLIERTVEIFMSIWRSERANQLEAEVRRLVAQNAEPTDPRLVDAQNRLINYKAETMQWTIPVGFTLGLLVSALGVRVLSQFVDLSLLDPAKQATLQAQQRASDQIWWFKMGDILFTGALLAGGADPIHKLLDLYRKFIESSAAKAAGTSPK